MPTSPRSLGGSLRPWAVQLALLALASAACSRPPSGAPPPVSIDQIAGRLLGAPGILVLPDEAWEPMAEGGWKWLRTGADFEVRLESALAQPLRFRLVIGAGRLRDVRWDGRPIRLHRLRARRWIAEVPAKKLTAGDHSLALRVAKPSYIALRRLTWRSGKLEGALDERRPGDLRMLRRFVDLGVAGREAYKNSGLLGLGSFRLDLAVDPERGSTLVAAVANASDTRGRFAILGPSDRPLVSAALDPVAKRILRVELPPGARRAALEVSGLHPDDISLWGGPFLLEERPRVPLVLLVTLDTTRRDALGFYGAPSGATPFLDGFARRATVYARASSTSSWTLPAHASIFTGLDPREHGAGVWFGVLPRRYRTLAERLSERYLTAGFAGGPLVRDTFGVAQGFGLYRVPPGNQDPSRVLVDEVIRLLDETRGLPLFLFVNVFDPHYAYQAPADLPQSQAARSAAERVSPTSPWRRVLEGDDVAWRDLIEQRIGPDSAGRAALRLEYAAEVAEADRQVGRLLGELDRRGLLDPALVVVAADHGELLGEGGFYSHAMRLDPELVDVPLLVKFPNQRERRDVDAPVSLADLFPTILHVVGLPAPQTGAIDLRDLAALRRRGGVAFEEREMFIHPFFEGGMRLASSLAGYDGDAGRIVRWDVGEQCWSGSPGARRVVPCTERLRAELRAEERAQPAPPRRGAELSPEERARLQALGYL